MFNRDTFGCQDATSSPSGPYPRPNPADRYEGEAQLEYLHAKALTCCRATDEYGGTGKDRWTVLMRCLVTFEKGARRVHRLDDVAVRGGVADEVQQVAPPVRCLVLPRPLGGA